MIPVLFAPHNDDEALFCSFTIQRVQPLVVVCYRSVVQNDLGITADERESETAAAMRALGSDSTRWHQWQFPDDGSTTDEQIEGNMWGLLDPMSDDKPAVFVPSASPRGHRDHNQINRVAHTVFDDVTEYCTYDYGGPKHRSRNEVEPTGDMILRKLNALACYRSQIERGPSRFWMEDLREYYA